MNLFVRVEASSKCGTGHLKRCIALSKKIAQNKNNSVIFFFSGDEHYAKLIEEAGFKFFILTHDNFNHVNDVKNINEIINKHKFYFDFILVDHYKIDHLWEELFSNYNIIVIDDLANRKHAADILIDQNLYMNMNQRYNGLVKKDCKILLGPQYAILDTKYLENRKNVKPRSKINNILISFGGTDENNLTGKLLNFFCSEIRFKEINFNVVITNAFKKKDELKSKYAFKNINFFENLDSLSDLMIQSDMSIGAGGSTTWERFAMGLPSIVISIAENQEESSRYLNHLGLIFYIGSSNSLKYNWLDSIEELIFLKNDALKKNSIKISNYVDGLGSQRIVKEIISY